MNNTNIMEPKIRLWKLNVCISCIHDPKDENLCSEYPYMSIVSRPRCKHKQSRQSIITEEKHTTVFEGLKTLGGSSTRSDLVTLIKLPRTTVYDILDKMISQGLVYTKNLPRSTRGRKKIMFVRR